MVAKVTGQAKYAEDFRAEGMLFVKLLLSPMPHARIRSIDASAALAMPGVKGILTADDLPAPASSVTDSGTVIQANPFNERALTKEPLYIGEPILAVAAVDELTAADAIERINVDFEPLPFITDPLDALRPGSPNPRSAGNVWMPPPAVVPTAGRGGQNATPPQPPPRPEVKELKWTDGDFSEFAEGKLPMGKPTVEWSFGDVEAGFKNAALVLDETFLTPSTSDAPLESRSVMAYWQAGKLYVHCSTQSTTQTVPAVARSVGIPPEQIVVISEYTGGGFGSKVAGAPTLAIAALLAKKVNAPVMMRISREEENYIGRWRAAVYARLKVGFDAQGRITAIDMFSIVDNGPYEQQSDLMQSGRQVSLMYQPLAMRWRGVAVLTNTTPTGPQSQPGGAQAHMVMEPVLAKASRKLGLDPLAVHLINAPAGKARFGGANQRGDRAYVTSAFVKEALERGAELFRWEQRRAVSRTRRGPKVRGIGIALSSYSGGSVGFDGLLIIRPDGRIQIQSGIGNLGTHSVTDVHRVVAEILDVPWERCDVVSGNTAKHLPWTCISGGSQTLHAMTRAAYAAATDAKRKLQEIAAKTFGGHPDDYTVSGERVSGNGRNMTFATAAQTSIELGGHFDGHEVPQDINRVTKASASALAGIGLMGVARDTAPRDGQTHSYVAAFAEVEVDVETGKYHILDYVAVADVGTVIHPHSLGGQILGRSILGMGHVLGQKNVYDRRYGVPLATRFYNNRPPTILDAPQTMVWDAVNIPDPETPVGARGIGEPPVGAGAGAILSALIDAIGEDAFRRAPVMLDTILTSLEAGRPLQEPLTAHI
jgi:CO/xanthine dehydrogenase Mo-binding subunit